MNDYLYSYTLHNKGFTALLLHYNPIIHMHPTQHFISTYIPTTLSRRPRLNPWQLICITPTFLHTLLSQRTMESAWCPRSDFRLVLNFCIIKSSSSQICTQGVAYYYSRLQLYSAVKLYPVFAKLVATFPDYYKHIKSHNMQCNWWCYATDIITIMYKYWHTMQLSWCTWW